jgi:hypothetical protein
MVKLWGREYTRAELSQRVGNLSQVGGVEATLLDDGPARGVRALRFTSAAGLSVTVLPDRTMDIADMRWRGKSLCWHGACGYSSPALYRADSDGFARSFFGGMLTTCGLTNIGPACEDGGEHFPMHGFAPSLPASGVAWGEHWEDDRCTLWARGMIRQWKLFGEHLTLIRHLRMDLAGAALTVEDVVRNEGHQETPHMILYHSNAGFPLLDEGALLLGNFASVEPRDEEARRGLDTFDRYTGPQPDFAEQVFIANLLPDEEGQHEVTLWNPALEGGLGLRLRWHAETLPWLIIWRMLGQGAYVLGMEPSNCPTIQGRAAARAEGTLPMLAPGEARRYRLEYAVVTAVDDSRLS